MNEFGAIHKGYFELANLIPKKDTGARSKTTRVVHHYP